MSIFIVRHGETHGNASRLIQGPETPLNERGIAQAEALAERLAREGVARIIVSDYARARMTADAVHRATGAPLEVDPRLRERDFGDWRGESHDVIPHFLDDGVVPPNGEAWEAFHARAGAAWERIAGQAREAAGNVVAVTHGLVCYSFALYHLALPAGVEAGLGFHNTSVTVADSRAPWAVTTLNCTAHLDEAIEARVATAS